MTLASAIKNSLNTVILTKWSPEFEIVFKSDLYKILKKSLSETIKNKLCDCIILQYKSIFPKGMPNTVSIEIENKVLGVCYIKIVQRK